MGSPPAPRLVEVPCPLCGADEAAVIRRESDRRFGVPLVMSVTRCRRCRMVYTNPRLAEANLAYEARDRADADYVRRHTVVKAPVFARAIERIARLVPPPATVLDVGCGVGGFLAVARERGYEVMGVEPSAADAAYARETLGLRVQGATFESADVPAGSADVVTLWDVIEHVAEPRAMVHRAFEVLRPGGVIAMRMPGATFHRLKGVAFALTRGSDAVVYSATIHLNFFSPRTARRLLGEAGFEGVRVLPTTPEAGHASLLANSARIVWGRCAAAVHFATGLCLENLEVYAVKPAARDRGPGSR